MCAWNRIDTIDWMGDWMEKVSQLELDDDMFCDKEEVETMWYDLSEWLNDFPDETEIEKEVERLMTRR